MKKKQLERRDVGRDRVYNLYFFSLVRFLHSVEHQKDYRAERKQVMDGVQFF